MPVRKNAYYNDPGLGAGLESIASAFKPPSGSDVYGYAHAAASRAKAAREAELHDYAKSPAYDQRQADQFGIMAGLFTPQQSYHSVNRTNETSLANNAADNARAIEVARFKESGDTTRSLLTPVAQGATRFVPPRVADLFGLPATQTGNLELKPGEITVTPGGAREYGLPKPLNESEAKAAEMQGLRKSGVIDDQTMKGIIFGTTPIETVQTPDGPRNMTRPDAIGQMPVLDPTKQSELATLQRERDTIAAINPKDTKIAEYNLRIQALGRGQQQDEYSKGIDKSMVELNEGLFKNAQTASSNVATLDRIQQLLAEGERDQGKWAGLRLEVRKGLNALGVPAGDTSPMEVARGLSNKFALQLRDPSSGAGMPGALSDSDREFLKSMSTSIDNSPEANKLVIDIYRRMSQRTIDLENTRRSYVKQHGRLDENFRSQLSDFVTTTPLFADMAGVTGSKSPSTPSTPPTPSPSAPSKPLFRVLSVE